MERLLEPIRPHEIVIARRWSKLEWEMNQKGVSQGELLAHYEAMGLYERKWLSHLEQLKSFELIRNALPGSRITVGEEIKKADFADAKLVVALGGDGHFSFVSHFVDSQYIVGVNADPGPRGSTGAILSFTPETFVKFLPRIKAGEFTPEYWTRLQIVLNGQEIAPNAISDVYIGARLSVDMSRYVLKFGEQEEEEKTSGLLVSTGTGSTGWHRKAHLTQQRESGVFSRNEIKAKFIAREEPGEPFNDYSLVRGELYPGEELVVHSYIDDAVVSPDSYRGLMYDFPAGSIVKVRVSEKPLKVITNKEDVYRYSYQIPLPLEEHTRGVGDIYSYDLLT